MKGQSVAAKGENWETSIVQRCMIRYDTPMETVRKAVLLKRLKAKITNLHYKEGQKLAINMEENELMGGGNIPLPLH